MRVVRLQVAPVEWALFIDKVTWDEWLFADGADGSVIDKGELLISFARRGVVFCWVAEVNPIRILHITICKVGTRFPRL